MVALVIFVGLTLQAGRLEGPASSSSSPVSSHLSPPLLAGRSGIRTCPTKVAKTILETFATFITSFRHHNHVEPHQQHDHDQHDHHDDDDDDEQEHDDDDECLDNQAQEPREV